MAVIDAYEGVAKNAVGRVDGVFVSMVDRGRVEFLSRWPRRSAVVMS
jgi:hypothetical protein